MASHLVIIDQAADISRAQIHTQWFLPRKVTILLVDEDALRRDGLAAVLQGTSRFEVVAQCPDGETAIDQIRRLQPDIAVIDLNLPRCTALNWWRRVRGEALGTKIAVLSGTADDEIVRGVVRAGGDGCLLKNGPARHLIDAISYVRDGGQYFSPQLRRDGRDRHLLQETPRVVTERIISERAARARTYEDGDSDEQPPASADTKTRLQAASQYTDRKDYSTAEEIYKQVLKSEPSNVEALKGLASVLCREDKIDESTAILDEIPRN